MNDKPRIAITGYFARGNLGDDAMVEGLTDFLARELPESKLERVPLPPTSRVDRLPSFFAALRSADWIVLAGGTHFHDKYGAKSWRLLAQMLAVLALARLAGAKVAFAGVGIGPLKTHIGRALTARLLSLAHVTSVRDSASRGLAISLGLTGAIEGFDLGLLTSRATEDDPPEAKQHRIGVSIVPYHALYAAGIETDTAMVNTLATALATYSERTAVDSIEVYPFCSSNGYSDVQVSRLLVERLNQRGLSANLVDCASPRQVRARLSGLQAFIGARYHSILLAYEAGLPVVPLIYHEKCDALADELGLETRLRIRAEDFLNLPKIDYVLGQLAAKPDDFRAKLDLEVAKERSDLAARALVRAIRGEGDETDASAISPALPDLRRSA